MVLRDITELWAIMRKNDPLIRCGATLKLVGTLVVATVIIGSADYLFDGRVKYALRYSVARENVTIGKKPHDCDWSAAPIGNKNCHYDKVVNSVRTGNDRTGRKVVSYDEGKTWDVESVPPPLSSDQGPAQWKPVKSSDQSDPWTRHWAQSSGQGNDALVPLVKAIPVTNSIQVSSVHVSWQKVEE
jgi:hypothetical protein